MAIKSPKSKGSGGEYEIICLLTDWAAEIGVTLELERNLEQVRRGGADVNGVPNMEVEVKRVETLAVASWWAQVCRAADQSGKVPLLAYRQNRKKWRFKTRQYVAIYGEESGTVMIEMELDLENAKRWFQYHIWLHREGEPQ